jgi:hypothetical protein
MSGANLSGKSVGCETVCMYETIQTISYTLNNYSQVKLPFNMLQGL